jgi:pyruvate formate lyase activating enzyme
MIIGGLRKISLIDYPDEVSTVVFTRGCNLRCIYCHNSHLVLPELYSTEISEEHVLEHFRSRKAKITSAVISGGEPTIHSDLPEFISKLKDIGIKVKVDTNGTNPGMIKKLIESKTVDFVAMDIKAPFDKYGTITGVKVSINMIAESIGILKNSSIKKEFRMTLLKGIHSKKDINMIKEIAGDVPLSFHNYKHSNSVLNKKLNSDFAFSETELLELLGSQ